MKLYHNFSVVLRIGGEELSIPYGCGVKQGNSLAPLLFLMVFQIAVESVKVEFIRNSIVTVFFKSSISKSAMIRKPSK